VPPASQRDLAKVGQLDHLQALLGSHDHCRLASPLQVACVDGVERDVRKSLGKGGCLGSAPLGQRTVGVALPAARMVPVGLAVAGEEQRRHAHILP